MNYWGVKPNADIGGGQRGMGWRLGANEPSAAVLGSGTSGPRLHWVTGRLKIDENRRMGSEATRDGVD